MNIRALTARTLGSSIIITALGFVGSVALSHWLGPSGRGEYAAATLWPMLLVYIASTGQFIAMRYYGALPNADTSKLCTNALLFTLVQCLIFMPLGYFFLPLMLKSQRSEIIEASRYFLWIIPVSLLTQYYGALMQAKMHIGIGNKLAFITPVGYVLGIAGLYVTHHLAVIPLVAMSFVLSVLYLIGTVTTSAILGFRLSPQIDRPLIKTMLGYGLKVQAGDIAGTITLRLDQTLLAAWLPPAQLGLYVAANSSVLVAQLLSGAVKTVTVPSISRQASLPEGINLLRRCFRKYWILSLVSAVTLAALLPFAIPLVFGKSFRPAIIPAEILLLATVIMAARDVLFSGVQALGKPLLGAQATIFAAVITILILPILVRHNGIIGAAVATLITYIGELGIFLYFLHGSTGISFRQLFFVDAFEARQLFSDLHKTLTKRAMADAA